MIKLIATVAACAVLAACGTDNAAKPTPAQVAGTIVANQAAIRAGLERAFSTSADSIETAFTANVLTGKALSQSRQGLVTAHAALLVGRAAFTASGAPTSADLISAQVQADADYTRVISELPAS